MRITDLITHDEFYFVLQIMEMAYFPTLLNTSTSEISTLSYS